MSSLLPVEHVCWSYDDPADFRAYAAAFLGAGAERGEYVWYVGTTAPELGRHARFVDVIEAYGSGHVVDPQAQVTAYAEATEAALAAGYTGLRVAAEVTEMVRTPRQLDAFARYEFLIGRYALTSPFRAVCGYDRRVLGDNAITELACLHPISGPRAAPFHLHPAASGGAFLDGELDADGEHLFATALRRTGLRETMTLHGDGLRFVDHRSLLTLQRYAERSGGSVVVRTPHGAAGRLAGLLGLSRVRVEAVL